MYSTGVFSVSTGTRPQTAIGNSTVTMLGASRPHSAASGLLGIKGIRDMDRERPLKVEFDGKLWQKKNERREEKRREEKMRGTR